MVRTRLRRMAKRAPAHGLRGGLPLGALDSAYGPLSTKPAAGAPESASGVRAGLVTREGAKHTSNAHTLSLRKCGRSASSNRPMAEINSS